MLIKSSVRPVILSLIKFLLNLTQQKGRSCSNNSLKFEKQNAKCAEVNDIDNTARHNVKTCSLTFPKCSPQMSLLKRPSLEGS